MRKRLCKEKRRAEWECVNERKREELVSVSFGQDE